MVDEINKMNTKDVRQEFIAMKTFCKVNFECHKSFATICRYATPSKTEAQIEAHLTVLKI